MEKSKDNSFNLLTIFSSWDNSDDFFNFLTSREITIEFVTSLFFSFRSIVESDLNGQLKPNIFIFIKKIFWEQSKDFFRNKFSKKCAEFINSYYEEMIFFLDDYGSLYKQEVEICGDIFENIKFHHFKHLDDWSKGLFYRSRKVGISGLFASYESECDSNYGKHGIVFSIKNNKNPYLFLRIKHLFTINYKQEICHYYSLIKCGKEEQNIYEYARVRELPDGMYETHSIFMSERYIKQMDLNLEYVKKKS